MNFTQLEFTLDSIIDAIESNAIKHAESLCEKALKKWPQSLQLKALRALIYFYSSKDNQAFTLAHEVVAQSPADFLTLSVLERVLEARDDYNTLADLYENAMKVAFDYRAAERLYYFYLRLQQTKKLYPIASKMYSTTKNVAYLYWSILGLIMHADNTQSTEESALQLELAKRILSKIDFPSADQKLAAAHKQLLVTVCSKSNDHDGLIKTLSLKTRYDPSDDAKILLKAYIESGKYTEALESAEKILMTDSNLDFEVWRMICGIPDYSNTLTTILSNFEAKQSSDCRGLKLAKMYLMSKLDTFDSQTLAQELMNYVLEMKSKASMVPDVVCLVKEFEHSIIVHFCHLVSAHINNIRSFDEFIENSPILFIIRFLSSYHQSSIPLSDSIENHLKSVKERIFTAREEVTASNDNIRNIALYVCLVDIDSYCLKNDYAALKHCYHFATECADRFSEVYIFQLMRFVAAANLGIFLPDFFDKLEIKCMQLDTLGYLMSDLAPIFLNFKSCKEVCRNSFNLYSSNRRDTWNLISQSLDNSSFISVLDFCEFSLRLENSLQYLSTDVLSLKTAILSTPIKDLDLSDEAIKNCVAHLMKQQDRKIADNRDTKIFDSIDPCGHLTTLVRRLISFNLYETRYYPYIMNTKRMDDIDGLDPLARTIASITDDDNSIERTLSEFHLFVEKALEEIKDSVFNFSFAQSISLIILRSKELHLVLSRYPSRRRYLEESNHFRLELIQFISKFKNSSSDLLEEQSETIKTIYNYLQTPF